MLKFPAIDAGEISTFRREFIMTDIIGMQINSDHTFSFIHPLGVRSHTLLPCPLWLRCVTRALELI